MHTLEPRFVSRSSSAGSRLRSTPNLFSQFATSEDAWCR